MYTHTIFACYKVADESAKKTTGNLKDGERERDLLSTFVRLQKVRLVSYVSRPG